MGSWHGARAGSCRTHLQRVLDDSAGPLLVRVWDVGLAFQILGNHLQWQAKQLGVASVEAPNTHRRFSQLLQRATAHRVDLLADQVHVKDIIRVVHGGSSGTQTDAECAYGARAGLPGGTAGHKSRGNTTARSATHAAPHPGFYAME